MNNASAVVEHILVQSNLTRKKLNGRELRVDDFALIVGYFVDELRNGRYPPLERLLGCAADAAANSDLVVECVNEFRLAMMEFVRSDWPDHEYFKLFCNRVFKEISLNFQISVRGGPLARATARRILENGIAHKTEEFRFIAFGNRYTVRRKQSGLVIGASIDGAVGGAACRMFGGASGGRIGGGAIRALVGSVFTNGAATRKELEIRDFSRVTHLVDQYTVEMMELIGSPTQDCLDFELLHDIIFKDIVCGFEMTKFDVLSIEEARNTLQKDIYLHKKRLEDLASSIQITCMRIRKCRERRSGTTNKKVYFVSRNAAPERVQPVARFAVGGTVAGFPTTIADTMLGAAQGVTIAATTFLRACGLHRVA